MSAWPTMRLDECCEIISGATPSTSVPSYWDGDICWATPKDLGDLEGPSIGDTPRKITIEGLKACAANILPPQSVLFSSRAPIGHVAINTVPMATNQGFKSMVPDLRLLDSTYLYHWLRCNRRYLESLGNGATFKEVSKAVVSRVMLPIPPLPEQRRIAAILDQADALRAKRRAALAQLDEMAQAMFVEMFHGPDRKDQEVLAETLGGVCHMIRDGTHHTPTYIDSGVPFVTVKNIVSGKLDLAHTKFISEEEHVALSRRVNPQRGDILVSKDGTIGVPCPIETDVKFSIFVSVALLRLKNNIVDQGFLCEQLRSTTVQKQIKESSKGIAIRHLHLEDFRRLKIIVPHLNMQREFSRRVTKLDLVRDQLSKHLSELNSLFASLQHRAFTGAL